MVGMVVILAQSRENDISGLAIGCVYAGCFFVVWGFSEPFFFH